MTAPGPDVADDLDALDRGVIEAGQLAAEAMARLVALEAKVAELARRVGRVDSVDGVMHQARLDWQAGQGEAHRPSRARPGRPWHLKAVPPIGGI